MYKYNYIKGEIIGELMFLNRVPTDPKLRSPKANFKCRCGKEFVTYINSAKLLSSKSCGCMKKEFLAKALTIHKPIEYASIGVKKMPDLRKQDVERFWGKIKIKDNKNECWLWEDGTGRYGYFRIGKGMYKANRLAYYLHSKVDPEDFSVLHSCHNSKCCNPAHLSLGTHGDNMEDMVIAGRQHKGSQINTAQLNEEQVFEIKGLIKSGFGVEFISRKYSVSSSSISNIMNGVTWKHI